VVHIKVTQNWVQVERRGEYTIRGNRVVRGAVGVQKVDRGDSEWAGGGTKKPFRGEDIN